MDRPINANSLDDIFEIIEDEVDVDIPEDKVTSEILDHNRDFFQNSDSKDIDTYLLIRTMTIQKLLELNGHPKLSKELDSTVDELKDDIVDTTIDKDE